MPGGEHLPGWQCGSSHPPAPRSRADTSPQTVSHECGKWAVRLAPACITRAGEPGQKGAGLGWASSAASMATIWALMALELWVPTAMGRQESAGFSRLAGGVPWVKSNEVASSAKAAKQAGCVRRQ